MTYDLIYSETALKSLKKLEKQIRERVIHVLERIRIRPHPYVKKLIGSPYFSLRAGDYRIILDIVENKLIILVLELGHRKNIYADV